MKLFILTILSLIAVACAIHPAEAPIKNEVSMSKMQWPVSSACQKVEISEVSSEKTKEKSSIAISDSAVIQKMIHFLEQIPNEGDEFISWGPGAKLLEMKFICEAPVTLRFYSSSLQSIPSGAFRSTPIPAEKDLYQYVKSLLVAKK